MTPLEHAVKNRDDLADLSAEGVIEMDTFVHYAATDDGQIFSSDADDIDARHKYGLMFEAFLFLKGWTIEGLSVASEIDIRQLNGSRMPMSKALDEKNLPQKLQEASGSWSFWSRLNNLEDPYITPSEIVAITIGLDPVGRAEELDTFMTIADAYFGSIPLSFGQRLSEIFEQKNIRRATVADATGVSATVVGYWCADRYVPEAKMLEAIKESLKLGSLDEKDLDDAWIRARTDRVFAEVEREKPRYQGRMGWAHLVTDLRAVYGYSRDNFPEVSSGALQKNEGGGFIRKEEDLEKYFEGMSLLTVPQRSKFKELHDTSKQEKLKKDPEKIKHKVKKIFDQYKAGKKYQGANGWGVMIADLRGAHEISRNGFPGIPERSIRQYEHGSFPKDTGYIDKIVEGLFCLNDEQKAEFKECYSKSKQVRDGQDPEGQIKEVDKVFKKLDKGNKLYKGKDGWGHLLRDLRRAHGITIDKFPGISKSNLNAYENGVNFPPGEEILEVAIAGLNHLTENERTKFRDNFRVTKTTREGKDPEEIRAKIDRVFVDLKEGVEKYDGAAGWGNLLKDLRKAHALFGGDFPGISKISISDYERKENFPGPEKMEIILDCLHSLTPVEQEIFVGVRDRSKAIKVGKDVSEAEAKIKASLFPGKDVEDITSGALKELSVRKHR